MPLLEDALREELSNRTGEVGSPEKIKLRSSNWSIAERSVTKYLSATTPSSISSWQCGCLSLCLRFIPRREQILLRVHEDVLMPENDEVLHVQDTAAE
jgi:hypothetical protein